MAAGWCKRQPLSRFPSGCSPTASPELNPKLKLNQALAGGSKLTAFMSCTRGPRNTHRHTHTQTAGSCGGIKVLNKLHNDNVGN